MTETKTVTRETVEVQTKEETLYVCANCEQAFEKNETVAVAVDVDERGKYRHKERLCERCRETILGHAKHRQSNPRISKNLTVPETLKKSLLSADAYHFIMAWGVLNIVLSVVQAATGLPGALLGVSTVMWIAAMMWDTVKA